MKSAIIISITILAALLLFNCTDALQTEQRDYIINIDNTSGLTVDSIAIIKTIGTAVDSFTLYSEDITESNIYDVDSTITGKKLTVIFQIEASQADDISVEYSCYSNNIAIIEKKTTLNIDGTITASNGGAHSSIIEILNEYSAKQADSTFSDSLGLTLDSLFIQYILATDSAEPEIIYNAYLKHPNSDTTALLNALLDTLEGRDTPYAETQLIAMLDIELTEIIDHIAVRDSLLSSSTISNAFISSSAAQPDHSVSSSSTTTISSQSISSSSIQIVLSSSLQTTLSSSSESIPIASPVRFTISGSLSGYLTTVSHIELHIDGASLPTTLIVPTAFDIGLSTYAGAADIDTTASASFTVQVKVFDLDSNMSGFSTATFLNTTYTIAIEEFNSANAKPWASINAIAAASINDTIAVTAISADTIHNGSISKIEWKHGTNSFNTQVGGIYTIILPDTASTHYPVYIRVTDNDSNTYIDSTTIAVLLDAPQISLTTLNNTVGVDDSITFIWSGTDNFGTIQEYSIKIDTAADWTLVNLDTTLTLPSTGTIETTAYYLQGIDDDSNITYDTITIEVINTPPKTTIDTITVLEGKSGYFTTITGLDPNGDNINYKVISNTCAINFSIGLTSGELSAPLSFDYETMPLCEVTISLSDNWGLNTYTIPIKVQDINETFYVLEGTSFTPTIFEDGAATTTLTVVDGDGTGAHWSILKSPNHGAISNFLPFAKSIDITYHPEDEWSGVDEVLVLVTDSGSAYVDTVWITYPVQAIDDQGTYEGTPRLSHTGTVTVGSNIIITAYEVSSSGGECQDPDSPVDLSVRWLDDRGAEIGFGDEYNVDSGPFGDIQAEFTCHSAGMMPVTIVKTTNFLTIEPMVMP